MQVAQKKQIKYLLFFVAYDWDVHNQIEAAFKRTCTCTTSLLAEVAHSCLICFRILGSAPFGVSRFLSSRLYILQGRLCRHLMSVQMPTCPLLQHCQLQ